MKKVLKEFTRTFKNSIVLRLRVIEEYDEYDNEDLYYGEIQVFKDGIMVHSEVLNYDPDTGTWKTVRKYHRLSVTRGERSKIFHRIARELVKSGVIRKHAELCSIYGYVSLLNL